jgi:hypothetical protein
VSTSLEICLSIVYADQASAHADFDPDQRLQAALALSRLVCPTDVGLAQSAQIWGDLTHAESIDVRPGPVTGPASEAYRADPKQRNWLTAAEVEELARLLTAYFAGQLGERLTRALFFHEFAACTLDAAVRWTLIATGLEALVNVGEERVSKQFRIRSVAIASAGGVPFSEGDARLAYIRRSQVSHGKVTVLPEDDWTIYIKMERVLRESLRRALADGEWAARFDSDASIEVQWPLPALPECPTCQRPL